MLTLYAASKISWTRSTTRSRGRSVKTCWRTSKVGSMRSHSRVITPRQPSASTIPGKSGSSTVDAHELTVGTHELDTDHRGRQVAQPVARPVGPGRARTTHRDVGQRSEVVQRPPLPVQGGRHLGVRRPGRDHGHPFVGQHLDRRLQRARADQRARGVGDRGERVRRAQGAHASRARHDLLQLFHRGRGRLIGCREPHVPAPVDCHCASLARQGARRRERCTTRLASSSCARPTSRSRGGTAAARPARAALDVP